jgi:hypothetical protein
MIPQLHGIHRSTGSQCMHGIRSSIAGLLDRSGWHLLHSDIVVRACEQHDKHEPSPMFLHPMAMHGRKWMQYRIGMWSSSSSPINHELMLVSVKWTLTQQHGG